LSGLAFQRNLTLGLRFLSLLLKPISDGRKLSESFSGFQGLTLILERTTQSFNGLCGISGGWRSRFAVARRGGRGSRWLKFPCDLFQSASLGLKDFPCPLGFGSQLPLADEIQKREKICDGQSNNRRGNAPAQPRQKRLTG
jgi:hypothetical protein